MDMAESEQRHRITMDAKVLESEFLLAKRGQQFGLITSIFCIVGAVLLGYFDMQWLGGILAGMSAIGLVREFIKRRESTRKSDPT